MDSFIHQKMDKKKETSRKEISKKKAWPSWNALFVKAVGTHSINSGPFFFNLKTKSSSLTLILWKLTNVFPVLIGVLHLKLTLDNLTALPLPLPLPLLLDPLCLSWVLTFPWISMSPRFNRPLFCITSIWLLLLI